MSDLLLSSLVYALKFGLLVYDVLSYIPSHIIYHPRRKLDLSNRAKARSVGEDGSGPWRSVESLDGLHIHLPSPYRHIRTLGELIRAASEQHGHKQCLGTRPVIEKTEELGAGGKMFVKEVLGDYEWFSYSEMEEQVVALGRGLVVLGQQPRSHVCIFAETRSEWMIAALACFRYNLTVVTVYATLGEEALIHAINESDSTTVITIDQLLPKFKKNLSSMKGLRHLIYMGSSLSSEHSTSTDGVTVTSFSALMQKGQNADMKVSEEHTATEDDLALIMYTSGTTAQPKGVMMTHGNLITAMSGMIPRIPNLGPQDTYIAYLPLAHVLELISEMSCLSRGVRIGYSSPQTITDQSTRIKRGSKGDCTVLKPTLLAAVPLILDRIYKAVWAKVKNSGALRSALFRVAYEYKKKQLARGFDTPIFNRFIFGPVRSIVGGQVRLIMSGSAPLSEETQRFMNICLGCSVGQGYGLTETCGAGTIQESSDLSTGRVGAPLLCSQILLRDWEQGGYSVKSTPPRGEVLLGGGMVTKGYYKNDAKTAEDFTTIDGTRYFCTGDIGEIHEDGCLKVIDRARDLVKLQAGEYVALNKVESALKMLPLVEAICVHVDSTKDFAVALMVPNKQQLLKLADSLGISYEAGNWEQLCQNEQIQKEALVLVQKRAKEARLERVETPARLALVCDEWNVESGLVTDTFKLKRRNISTQYKATIEQLYK